MELALTILDYASYVVGIAAVIGIIVIVIRKFRVVASINTSAIPKHQQEEVHKKLAAERLQRKFEKAGGVFEKFVKPIFATAFVWVKKGFQSLIKIERQMAVKVAKTNAQVKEKAEEKIEQLQEQADVAEDEKDFVEAEQKYIEMITLNPHSREAFKQLGDLYMEMKDFKSADETYRHILTLIDKQLKNPEPGIGVPEGTEIAEHNADASESNMGLENWSAALTYIDNALKVSPNNPKYLDMLFEISMKQEDYDRANKALTKLKEVNPENKKLEDFIDQLARVGK